MRAYDALLSVFMENFGIVKFGHFRTVFTVPRRNRVEILQGRFSIFGLRLSQAVECMHTV